MRKVYVIDAVGGRLLPPFAFRFASGRGIAGAGGAATLVDLSAGERAQLDPATMFGSWFTNHPLRAGETFGVSVTPTDGVEAERPPPYASDEGVERHVIGFDARPAPLKLSSDKVLFAARDPNVFEEPGECVAVVWLTANELAELAAIVASGKPADVSRPRMGPTVLRPTLARFPIAPDPVQSAMPAGRAYVDRTQRREVYVGRDLRTWVDAGNAAA